MKEKRTNKLKKDKVERKKSSDKMPENIVFTDNINREKKNVKDKKDDKFDYINLNEDFLKEYFTLK